MKATEALRILVVEDHDGSRTALRRLLQRCGHEPHCADCSARALAEANARTFDVAICDIGLPDGDGYELIRTLREAHGLPCIAVTGLTDEEHGRLSSSAGICVHLRKPIAFQKLLDAIEQCRAKAGEPA